MKSENESVQEVLCPLRRRAGGLILGFAVANMAGGRRIAGHQRLRQEDAIAGMRRLLCLLSTDPSRLPKPVDVKALVAEPETVTIANGAKEILDSFGYRFVDRVHDHINSMREGGREIRHGEVVDAVRATASQWLGKQTVRELDLTGS